MPSFPKKSLFYAETLPNGAKSQKKHPQLIACGLALFCAKTLAQ